MLEGLELQGYGAGGGVHRDHRRPPRDGAYAAVCGLEVERGQSARTAPFFPVGERRLFLGGWLAYEMILWPSTSLTTQSPEFRSEVKMCPLWICAPQVIPQLGTVDSESMVLSTAISRPWR